MHFTLATMNYQALPPQIVWYPKNQLDPFTLYIKVILIKQKTFCVTIQIFNGTC